MNDRLRVTGISKSFPGQRALDDVSLKLAPGEVRGLLGANGSGKSTLVKVLAGVYTPDRSADAEVVIDGQQLPLPLAATTAKRAGLRFVHQDLALIERRPVLENVALDRPFLRNRFGLIDWKAERRLAEQLLEEFEVSFGVDELVAHLSPAQRTLVAIVRAFDLAGGGMRVLVLDEPTAGLPSHEVDLIFSTIERVSRRGVAVIFVSHSIKELMEVCRTVTVLRDGRLSLDARTADVTPGEVVQAITGRVPSSNRTQAPDERTSGGQSVALSVAGLSSATVRDFGITLEGGEICGIAGNLDSGASEVLPALYGAEPGSVRSLTVGERAVSRLTPRSCRRAGLAYVPPDRLREGLLQGLTVRENIVGGDFSGISRHGILMSNRERDLVQELVDRFDIQPPRPNRPVDKLSGGNQQKTLLARWFRLEPRVLLLQEPTQGVDIGARDEIADQIRGAASKGCSVLVSSTDEAELARLCDRVIIMRAGKAVLTLKREQLSLEAIRHAIHDTGDQA